LAERLAIQDFDPAATQSGESGSDFNAARDLSNYGPDGRQTFQAENPLAPATLNIDWQKVQDFLTACENSVPKVGYKLGAKVPNDNSVPGVDFTNVDCSGFVRAAIRRSTNPESTIPDGSVVQHDWVKAKGFAASSVADGNVADGKVRIAFLEPKDSNTGIGHVVLIRNRSTSESHGGLGPDSRPFDGKGWQVNAKVYILTN
jgi:hypothetical protein